MKIIPSSFIDFQCDSEANQYIAPILVWWAPELVSLPEAIDISPQGQELKKMPQKVWV